jgi:hypothetical protein
MLTFTTLLGAICAFVLESNEHAKEVNATRGPIPAVAGYPAIAVGGVVQGECKISLVLADGSATPRLVIARQAHAFRAQVGDDHGDPVDRRYDIRSAPSEHALRMYGSAGPLASRTAYPPGIGAACQGDGKRRGASAMSALAPASDLVPRSFEGLHDRLRLLHHQERVRAASADLTLFYEDTCNYHPNGGFPGIYCHDFLDVPASRCDFRHCTKVGQPPSQHRHGRRP